MKLDVNKDLFSTVIDYGDYGHAVSILILELNAFATPSPVVKIPIQSYVAEYLESGDHHDLIRKYELESFELLVLDARRTFVEKLLNLSRNSLKEDSKQILIEMVRHFYDIHKLTSVIELKDFFESGEFAKLTKLALHDDLSNPLFSIDWTVEKLADAELFLQLDSIIKSIEGIYYSDFQSILYGHEQVELIDIHKTFESIKQQLPDIEIRG